MFYFILLVLLKPSKTIKNISIRQKESWNLIYGINIFKEELTCPLFWRRPALGISSSLNKFRLEKTSKKGDGMFVSSLDTSRSARWLLMSWESMRLREDGLECVTLGNFNTFCACFFHLLKSPTIWSWSERQIIKRYQSVSLFTLCLFTLNAVKMVETVSFNSYWTFTMCPDTVLGIGNTVLTHGIQGLMGNRHRVITNN